MINELKNIILEELDVEGIEITENTKIVEDLGADSLDRIEIMTIIGEKYNLEVNQKELKNIKTVGDIINYIKRNDKNE